MDLNREQLSVPITDDFDLRKKPRLNRIADQIRGTLLQIQGLLTPRTSRVRSVTPIRMVPPAVLAKAATVRRKPCGDDRSRLNSSVFPSGLRSISARSTTAFPSDALHDRLLGNLLGSSRHGQASELWADGSRCRTILLGNLERPLTADPPLAEAHEKDL